MGNGLHVPVYTESSPLVSVKRLSNVIPTYGLTNIFDKFPTNYPVTSVWIGLSEQIDRNSSHGHTVTLILVNLTVGQYV